MSLLNRIWAAMAAPRQLRGLHVDGLILQFMAAIAGASEAPAPRPEDARMARAINYVEAHLAEALSLPLLASVAGLSTAQFSRVFGVTIGEPVWNYVQRRRAARAHALIVGTRLPLTEVAHRCGYGSVSILSRAIRRAYKVTPSALRG